MAESSEIRSFSNEVDSTITNAVNNAKNYYTRHLDEMDSLGIYPSGSHVNLIVSEMRRVQKEQYDVIEGEIIKVDKRLLEMEGNAKAVSDMAFLIPKLSGWVSRLNYISIPQGKYTEAYAISASFAAKSILYKWEDYKNNDLKFMKLLQADGQRLQLEQEIVLLEKTADDIERTVINSRDELNSRTLYKEKYENEVKEEHSIQLDKCDRDIKLAKDDLDIYRFQEKSLQNQLAFTGIFSFGKKKELKNQLEILAGDIEKMNDKVLALERRRMEAESELPQKLSELEEKRRILQNEIVKNESSLKEYKAKVNRKKRDLQVIEEKMMAFRRL